jgi:hypothetical protein
MASICHPRSQTEFGNQEGTRKEGERRQPRRGSGSHVFLLMMTNNRASGLLFWKLMRLLIKPNVAS